MKPNKSYSLDKFSASSAPVLLVFSICLICCEILYEIFVIELNERFTGTTHVDFFYLRRLEIESFSKFTKFSSQPPTIFKYN